jgi:lysozyme
MSWLRDMSKPEQLEPTAPRVVVTPPLQTNPKPAPSGEVVTKGIVRFIDVSRYQPKMNWDAVVSAGFLAAVAKATDGQGSVDQMFRAHAAAAKLRGMPVGAYCFNRFSADPVKQADHFAKTVEGVTRWVVADIEWDRSKTTEAKFGKRYGEGKTMDDFGADHAMKFLERLEVLGFKPWVYSNTYFLMNFKNPERFLRFPYWASNYTQKKKAIKDLDVSKVPLPKPYKKCIAWQYTDVFPGAKAITGDGNLDANLGFLSIAELEKLSKG